MKCREVGFRAVYHQFCAFMLSDRLREAIRDFPGAKSANCALTWGYIDPEQGLCVELLCCGRREGESFSFAKGRNEIHRVLPIRDLEEAEFLLIEDRGGSLAHQHAKKLKALERFAVSEEVEKTRTMSFLDALRDPYSPDEVQVTLQRRGRRPERCRVRITGLAEAQQLFLGELLEEPQQDFQWHEGERVAFYLHRTPDGQMVFWTNLNPPHPVTQEQLQDGTLLKEAIHVFSQERTEESLDRVLELLRDSEVWIPCDAILSDADSAAMEQRLREAMESEEGMASLIDRGLDNQDEIHLVPRLLTNETGAYFPVFTSPEEMGEAGEEVSRMERHFLRSIVLARGNRHQVQGIVVNAFSEAFTLPRELFDVVLQMKSQLVDEPLQE